MVTSISAAVGKRNRQFNVTNKTVDQEKIAKLLATIPATSGGMQERWSTSAPVGTDGDCPSDLADAIWQFQEFWKAKGKLYVVDGVVDPGKNSLRRLNELSAATPSFLDHIYGLIPRALQRQRSALTMLGWAQVAVDFSDTNNFNKDALKLVHRCFKILETTGTEDEKKTQQRKDIATISEVYRNGVLMLLEAQQKRIYFSDKPYFGPVTTDNADTYYAGEFARRSPVYGITFNQPQAVGKSDAWLLDAMTHEIAHFCGPKPPNDVGDHGYGDAALRLPRAKAIKNAANHAWFAGLSETPQNNWAEGTYPS